MAFSEDDKILIKVLRLEKGYGARRIKSEFPNKNWNLSSLSKLIKKIDETGSTERKAGSGRPRFVATANNIEAIEELILSQEEAPGSHLSIREIGHTLDIPKSSVNVIVKRDLRLACFKRKKAQELTPQNKASRLIRAGQLLRKFKSHVIPFIWFTDEKLFHVASPKNSQNCRLYAAAGTRKKEIATNRLLAERPTFSKSIMVSVGVSLLGTTELIFVEPGVKINSEYYRNNLLARDMLPVIREISGEFFILQQDSAPAHRARETIAFLKTKVPQFISPSEWPPNSPDLNPVDYTVWGALEQRVYRHKVKDINELRQRLVQEWNSMDHKVIESAIQQWRKRLQACVAAKGGHFEYKL